jgi:hypothetical protein
MDPFSVSTSSLGVASSNVSIKKSSTRFFDRQMICMFGRNIETAQVLGKKQMFIMFNTQNIYTFR